MTTRQQQLLLAIIEEFINTAEAVGSESLRERRILNVSPATIRNEMAALCRGGYLMQPHSSAGRTPTPLGMRFFIKEILEKPLNLSQGTKEEYRHLLFHARFDPILLVREALSILARVSGNATVALVNGQVFYSGLSEMLDMPEFHEPENLRPILGILEDYSKLSLLFNQHREDNDVHVLLGEETGLDGFTNYALIFSELRMHGSGKGYIAVIGPNRMHYQKIIPAVRYIAATISQAVSSIN